MMHKFKMTDIRNTGGKKEGYCIAVVWPLSPE